MVTYKAVILLHEKLLQFDWLRAVVFQLNLKYLPVKHKRFVGSSINKKQHDLYRQERMRNLSCKNEFYLHENKLRI